MKKTHAIALSVFALMLTLSIFAVPGESSGTSWGVAAAQGVDYNLNQININYSFPPSTYTAASITFDNGTLPFGSIISLNITSVTDSEADYQLGSGIYSEDHSITNNSFTDQIEFMLMLPLKIANEEVSLNDIKRGFTGIDHILIPTLPSTWQSFSSYADPIKLIATEEMFSTVADVDIQAKNYINATQDVCIFDWYVNGSYYDESESIDFTIYYNLKVAYEVSSGLLFGKRVVLELIGDHPDEDIHLTYSSELERSDYTLGEFLLPSDDGFNLDDLLSSLFPGFKWYIIPIVFCPLILGTRIIAKRKR
ncbi:MAG: hypothetical protein FK733_17930 [Asgard group archaeon]|nr:hypothetical protein [Asgard group archaeon]